MLLDIKIQCHQVTEAKGLGIVVVNNKAEKRYSVTYLPIPGD